MKRNKGRRKQGWNHFHRFISTTYLYFIWFSYQTLFYLYLIFSHSVLCSTYNKNGWHLSYFSFHFFIFFFTRNGSSFHIILYTTELSTHIYFFFLWNRIHIKYYQGAVSFIQSNPICNKSMYICSMVLPRYASPIRGIWIYYLSVSELVLSF